MVTELLRQLPERGHQILPLLKEKQYAMLYAWDWYVMSYVKEADKILFQPTTLFPKRLRDGHCLLCSESLTFMMRQNDQESDQAATYAMETAKRPGAKINHTVKFGTPTNFRDVCERTEALVLTLHKFFSTLTWR